jgi:hypothetical protein
MLNYTSGIISDEASNTFGNDTEFELTNILTFVSANEISNDNTKKIIEIILFVEIPKMRFVVKYLFIYILYNVIRKMFYRNQYKNMA